VCVCVCVCVTSAHLRYTYAGRARSWIRTCSCWLQLGLSDDDSWTSCRPGSATARYCRPAVFCVSDSGTRRVSTTRVAGCAYAPWSSATLAVQSPTTSEVQDQSRRRSRWSAAEGDACGRDISQLDRVGVPDASLLLPRDSGPQATDTAACTETMAAQSVRDFSINYMNNIFTCAFCT